MIPQEQFEEEVHAFLNAVTSKGDLQDYYLINQYGTILVELITQAFREIGVKIVPQGQGGDCKDVEAS